MLVDVPAGEIVFTTGMQCENHLLVTHTLRDTDSLTTLAQTIYACPGNTEVQPE